MRWRPHDHFYSIKARPTWGDGPLRHARHGPVLDVQCGLSGAPAATLPCDPASCVPEPGDFSRIALLSDAAVVGNEARSERLKKRNVRYTSRPLGCDAIRMVYAAQSSASAFAHF